MNILFGSTLIIYVGFIILFGRIEIKKYKKNTPYIQSKKKKSLLSRIKLGILAGIHYSHFIGTYNHKKYNTQVFTPETLECDIGGSLAAILIIIYPILAYYLQSIYGDIYLFILTIPIITNLISIYISKKY